MKIRIAGIRRSHHYSSNYTDKDSRIFNKTVQYLTEKGFCVTEYSEKEFQNDTISENFIFSMARNPQSILRLKELEKEGKVVINSGEGVENCTRDKMISILLNHKIPIPKSYIVPTDVNLAFRLEKKLYWIKRSDSHSIEKEDVVFIEDQTEIEKTLQSFSKRNIPLAVISEHIEGDLIKFYGIKDSDFFFWFYPEEFNHSKFGMEEINGKPQGLTFNLEDLKRLSNDSSKVLNVDIYGGDCVVDQNGNIKIIDFNDWPSFAPCLDKAASQIAEYIFNTVNNKKTQASNLI